MVKYDHKLTHLVTSHYPRYFPDMEKNFRGRMSSRLVCIMLISMHPYLSLAQNIFIYINLTLCNIMRLNYLASVFKHFIIDHLKRLLQS